ncbi:MULTISPECIES: NAD-dependent epimerase/dehydratase family protein [unclassified Luteimonas]|uniref:NAD-dependent epimerase/dehydratase family protein n=1 Tax=unclassified Luteimonas TaxID=2629088 RepID=UPI0018F06791|nr:NAD-dependent epimerase/dehydratase family protein [Luteimonas sp. MC1750]MBJ6978855.1 NAD-dependent epimerase/dehydratase family protein [Luteimonas sp. MC1895]MBJ6984896.1 NAD-dependent epimerase/dehydratase family protein [Luteimonas sp. MC1750]QQO05580.1 NAD-dependent epimerase/dehydratase family protein [Luteimonas sp. MC1750]
MSATGARALLFGGSGQVGAAVLARLLHAGWEVDALSRSDQVPAPGLRWLRGGFDAMPALARRYDAIVSCGPLDHFAHWQARTGIDASRVVAFGSTSLAVKRGSADDGERGLAARLAAAEGALFAAAKARGTTAIVLRPTLVYGAGRDQTLTRIAAMARRAGAFPLPRGAVGLRQPVHVDDLAATALAALAARGAGGRGYDLPGGETLAYRDMVARVLAALEPPARLVELPAPLFALLAGALRATGRLQGFGAEAQARLRQDLVFDLAPAARALGHAPRAFNPDAAMFQAR